MKLADVINRERDAFVKTFTGLIIVTPREALHPDYRTVEDYILSARTGTGALFRPKDYDWPVENYPASVLLAFHYAEEHANDLDVWRYIHPPNRAPYWESGDGKQKISLDGYPTN